MIRGAWLWALLSACSTTQLEATPHPDRCTLPDVARQPLVPVLPDRDPLTVRPVLFLPADAALSAREVEGARDALRQHLALARAHYQRLLRFDTFRVAWSEPWEYRSPKPNAFFTEPDPPVDSAHRIAKELLAWQEEDRFSSDRIYLTLYVRPADQPFTGGPAYFGGGRTFNGPPNTGGGYVEMEYSSLRSDFPFPFQSTLVHELGHAFGLTHVDCLGRNASTDGSIMSLNPSHHSRGIAASSEPGGFNPEELFVLSLNRRAFPDLRYCEETFGPVAKGADELAACFLGPMSREIGDFADMPGVGYELFYDGSRVNGPEAALYAFRAARANCLWATEQHANVEVECRYNGVAFSP